MEPVNRKNLLAGTIGVLAFVAIMSFAVGRCSVPVSHVPDERAGGDTLNVAVELSPMTLSTAADTLCGFGYEMLMQITASHGIPVKVNAFSSLPDALSKLDSGRYDLVVSDMPVTASIRERYGFTVPVYRDRLVLVQLADSAGVVEIASQQELGGKEVWAAAGTPVVARLNTLGREIGDTIHVCEDFTHTEEQLIVSVVIGEVPRVAAGQSVALRMVADYPRLDTSVDLSFSQLKCWTTCKSDTVLLDSLNAWIDVFKAGKCYTTLLKKYDVRI
ncbi:MAG: transporter substrate-binding domain-containing protein [Muribaculaceae bacterium]|nr:transporter substrate-binding domain-containing protein [Muribaculaceae bacterium]